MHKPADSPESLTSARNLVVPGRMVQWKLLPWWVRWPELAGPLGSFLLAPAVHTVTSVFASARSGYVVTSGHYACLGTDQLCLIVTDRYDQWTVKETVDRGRELSNVPLDDIGKKYPETFLAQLSEISVVLGPAGGRSEEVFVNHRGVRAFRAASFGPRLMLVDSLGQGNLKFSTLFDKEAWRAFLSRLRAACAGGSVEHRHR